MTVNSSKRFSLEEEGLILYKRLPYNKVVLKDQETDDYFLYKLNDQFVGTTIEIKGKGYEFVSGNVDGFGKPLNTKIFK